MKSIPEKHFAKAMKLQAKADLLWARIVKSGYKGAKTLPLIEAWHSAKTKSQEYRASVR